MSVLVAVELIQATCCVANCGCIFGLSKLHYESLRETHASFHCPNGHPQHFTAESETERLERQLRLANERRELEVAEQQRRRGLAERQAAAAKGRITRLTNRVKKGVCPFCNRTFGNLARHMASRHTEEKKCEHDETRLP